MADKKISALPPASTPLAGTEVLPIVQGGITEQVSVANLTAGRAVSCTGLTSLDTIGMSTSRAIGSGNGYAGNFSAFSFGTLTLYDVDGAAVLNSQTNLSGAGVKIQTLGATNLWVRNTGNVDIPTGNLVIGTAGKGIDFSAATHAAGMTSELLNDYEEGTWTPTLATNGFSGGVTLSSASGTYTKIGRQVTLQCTLNLSDFGYPSSIVEIGGLPYTPAARNAGAYMGAHPSSSMGGACGVTNGGAVIYIPPSVATGTSTVWAATITYFV
jgi:hypothetical protein